MRFKNKGKTCSVGGCDKSGLYLRGEWFAITHEEAKEILRRIEKND